MNRAARLYCVAVIVAGTVVLSTRDWGSLSAITPTSWTILIAIGALAIVTELLIFEVTVGAGAAASSLAFVPLLASVILFPTPQNLVMAVTVHTFAQLIIHKKGALRGAFNLAQMTICVVVAAEVYTSLGGIPGNVAQLNVLNFVACAGTYFFINQLLITLALSLIHGERIPALFARIVSASGANLFYDILVSPIAVVLAVLCSEIGIAGVGLVFLPLLLIRYAYSSIQKLQKANQDILHVLIKAIETRDPYTSGHSLRVAQLAKAIAEDLDLGPAKIDEVYMAALVHDIGKVDSIYADIIRKESSLTDPERRVIMTHPAKGAEFLTTLSSFKESVIQAVRHHHERFDGTGYPDGLAGADVPLASRIIMLCDSIDAMLSDRPYRRALSVGQVRSELVRCSGTQFDPRIVQVILKRNTLERAAQLAAPAAKKLPLSVAV